MELGGIGEGVGWEEGDRAAMGHGGQEHFPRGQVLATFQSEVPHCQPLFVCAGIGTEGGGMTIALRSRGEDLVTWWELTMPFVFVVDCPPIAAIPSATVVIVKFLRFVSLS